MPPSFRCRLVGIRILAIRRPVGLPLLLVSLLELRDHGGVGERRRVAQGAPLGDVAQQAAHDLAGSGLGKLGGEEDLLGAGDGADLLDDVLLEILGDLCAVRLAFLQRDERGNRLTFDRSRSACGDRPARLPTRAPFWCGAVRPDDGRGS